MRQNRLAILALAVTAASLSSCSGKKEPAKGQLMLSVQTDMSIPKDVDQVRIEVTAYGNLLFGNDYDVGPSGLRIPATLGIVAGKDPATPVRIRVIARQNKRLRTLKEAVTTVPADRVAMLRMPIHWLCDGQAKEENEVVTSTCAEGQTCAAGKCVNNYLDSSKFSNYSPEEVFGGGTGNGDGSCFDTLGCFAQGYATEVDQNCTIALPASDKGVSVALVKPLGSDGICGPEACLVPLDSDSEGGWIRQNARIALPKIVCERLASTDSKTRILHVAVTTACESKTERLPTCGPWSSAGSTSGATDAGAPDGALRDARDASTDSPPTDAELKDAWKTDVAVIDAAPDKMVMDAVVEPCSFGTTECLDGAERFCENGHWVPGQECEFGCRPSGDSCAECKPDTHKCVGTQTTMCTQDGSWQTPWDCGTAPYGTLTCSSTTGLCEVICVPGHADCNNKVDDGCEADLAHDPVHCNTCSTACSDPTPDCIGGQCGEGAVCETASSCTGSTGGICLPTWAICAPNQCDPSTQTVCSDSYSLCLSQDMQGSGACYRPCTPFTSDACPGTEQCVPSDLDWTKWTCRKVGMGTPEGACEPLASDISTGCLAGFDCVKQGFFERCREVCDYWGIPICHTPEQYCEVSGHCVPQQIDTQLGYDTVAVGEMCKTSGIYCAPMNGKVTGFCLNEGNFSSCRALCRASEPSDCVAPATCETGTVLGLEQAGLCLDAN